MKIVVIGGSGLIEKKVVTNDQSLILGDNPRICPTRFEDWLRRSVRQGWNRGPCSCSRRWAVRDPFRYCHPDG